MDFRETDEQQMLREAVGAIASKYGHAYFTELRPQRRQGRRAVGRAGRGGLPRRERAGRVRRRRAWGSPSSPSSSRSWPPTGARCCCWWCRRRSAPPSSPGFGTDEQKQRWLPRFATGRAQDGVRHHRARRRARTPTASPPPPRATATSTGSRGPKYYISGADESEAVAGRHAHRRRRGHRARAGCRCSSSTSTVPGSRQDARSPSRSSLRRSSSPCSSTTSRSRPTAWSGTEGDGLRQVFVGLNPERIMSAAMANGIGRYALDKAAAYARDRSVWGTPIGAPPGHLAPAGQVRRSRSSWPGSCARRRRGPTTPGPMGGPGRRPTWPSTPAAEAGAGGARPGDPDPRRQRDGVGVRPGRHVGHGPAPADRPGEPRDDPQLRGPALARAAEVLLIRPESSTESEQRRAADQAVAAKRRASSAAYLATTVSMAAARSTAATTSARRAARDGAPSSRRVACRYGPG